MKTNFQMVREFHRAFACPDKQPPARFAPPLRMALRVNLIAEEFQELRAAIDAGDLVGAADALGDLLYVIYGTGAEMGVDLDRVFAEIHRSNMSKLDENGRPLIRGDGKILKGPNYSAPDLLPILE